MGQIFYTFYLKGSGHTEAQTSERVDNKRETCLCNQEKENKSEGINLSNEPPFLYCCKEIHEQKYVIYKVDRTIQTPQTDTFITLTVTKVGTISDDKYIEIRRKSFRTEFS